SADVGHLQGSFNCARLFAGFGLVEVAVDVGEELVGGWGRGYSSLQNGPEADLLSVELAHGLLVGVDVGSVQSGSDKGALGARVGEDGRGRVDGGIGAGLAAPRAGGDFRV